MDPDVSVYPLPVLLVSLCQGQSVGLVSGAGVEHFPPPQPTPRRPPKPCCRGACGGRALLLVPALLLLLLGLGACLLLLRRALIQGAGRSREPDWLDLLRGEDEEEKPGLDDALWTHSTPMSSYRWFPESLPTLAPGVASSEPTSSPTSTLALTSPSSAPPPLVTTTLSPGSGHARRCNESEKAYCVNGGDCYYIHGINRLSCKCPNDFTGDRCQTYVMASFYQSLGIEFMEAEELYQKRVLTITGICVALLVVGIVCVVAYCKTNLPPRKQRKKMHNHLRQNIYVDHPNRNLANGPNHPGPGPEEIPMVDYISKNVPATERVIRHGAEAPFPGSRQSSRSHNSSTRAHSSAHRHEGRTWSLERTDSVLSDCPSGMMSSSVGTSKCNSPACMEARARRAAHCGFTEPHRPALQYSDSFDSLGDSPHSDRYVSALTTPARLSPVDFHYSMPPQVPTFQITSPNASHAMSLPPAVHAPYPPEEDQPLLRRYQVPLHEARVHEPYRQQQRGSYLRDSTGSLPSSPYRLAQEEEYESTQEYRSSMEQPKRSSRHWHRSRLNGHVAPRGYQPSRDLGSRSCLSDSDSEEGEGESTPFLSMQNMNTGEPVTLYRPVPNTQTSHTQRGRHGPRPNTQTRLTHSRSKLDNAPH
ncbi:pro-neuregulin-2, membrane-bound isoform-like isoform X5 [Carassius carassius]|uniref:pro-neuregulin-2, membrane-bound isoform-like isoform X5 n=1 Tax=Carassius carassius TaxID=217509 RepID=UPI002868BDA2|nr:pro-neuregulin-2, membrane-bound isoform-like isoform X5 [Carassius carassius]